jgi:hypothetical protein
MQGDGLLSISRFDLAHCIPALSTTKDKGSPRITEACASKVSLVYFCPSCFLRYGFAGMTSDSASACMLMRAGRRPSSSPSAST